MMVKQNIKQIANETNKNNRHKNYRRIATPNGKLNKHVSRPFSGEFTNGNFRNDIYFTMNPAFIVWVYIKNILLYAAPALLLHGVMFGIHTLSTAIMGDEYTAPAVAFQLLFITYAICLFFGLRKVSDHMAYYNLTMLVSKFKINQTLLTMIYRSSNVGADKEITVMDHYRQKFNKYSLFPSMKEIALEEQLYNKESKSRKDNVRQYAETRRQRLSVMNKRNEHMAAKEIADWKQAQYGGVNEYDAMVAKYKHRTTPAIKNIINDAKNQPNYNI